MGLCFILTTCAVGIRRSRVGECNMATETYYRQELEDLAFLLLNESANQFIGQSASAGEGLSGVDESKLIEFARTNAAALVDTWTHSSFTGYQYPENRYMPSSQDEKRLLERVQLWSGTHHVSAHDAMYYLIYVASITILTIIFDSALKGAGFSWAADHFAEKFSDSWGKKSGIIRVDEADQPIACAAIALSCGNPFGISASPSAVTPQEVTDELAEIGFFINRDNDGDACCYEPLVFPNVLLSDQPISGVRSLLSFERCPVELSQERRVAYVSKSLDNLAGLGVFKLEGEKSYRYCS